MNQKKKGFLVSVVGLGKLGLPLAVSMASRGVQVVGYDSDLQKIERLKNNILPFEPGLETLIGKTKSLLRLTSQIDQIVNSRFIFIIVPTPSKETGAFSLQFLKKALSQIGKILKKSQQFSIISVVSTVLPGDMEKMKFFLERVSRKKCGTDFGFCYNPAFVALGNVIKDFMTPDFVLIGESDSRSGKALEQFQARFCLNRPKVHRMNFVNAELTKIALNTYVTMKISFGNTLAQICEQLGGADADVVTEALGSDSRINKKYLKGALGYGGPCFPRDNRAFSFAAKKAGVKAFSSEATDQVNKKRTKWAIDLIRSEAEPGDTIGILGLSYKEGTDVIEASQGLEFATVLAEEGRSIMVYDPQAMGHAKEILGESVSYASSVEECLKKANVIVIVTPCESFSKITEKQLVNGMFKKKVLIDCWRILKNKRFSKQVKYLELGKTLAPNGRVLIEAAS